MPESDASGRTELSDYFWSLRGTAKQTLMLAKNDHMPAFVGTTHSHPMIRSTLNSFLVALAIAVTAHSEQTGSARRVFVADSDTAAAPTNPSPVC